VFERPSYPTVLSDVLCRKRPRLDGDAEAGDVDVKTEPFIPGLDLVDDAVVKDEDGEDILNTGVAFIVRLLRPTQPSIPPGSVNEYQLKLGRQRRVWLIPVADERVGVQVKLRSLENM